jgi:ABC-2 type transport system ATP-binding protein
MTTNSILEFTNVSRAYTKGVNVLDGVSFSIAPGEVVGLLGRNGAGKTTLIRIAMGMLYPHGGAVRVFGLSPTDDPVAVKKRVGYVAEDQVFPARLTIAELIDFHRYLFPRWDEALERQLLDRFALRTGAKIKQLSKGEARQVALLCAVCHRPELLILDEPAGGLDPAARREFLETSIQLLNREGTAILFSSHHMSDVERIGGRVVLLDKGKVRLDRDLDELREEISMAMVPRAWASDAAAIEKLPGCLGVRLVLDEWHAVFNGDSEAVHQKLQGSLGATNIRCVSLPLEELFIELVGGDRKEAGAA